MQETFRISILFALVYFISLHFQEVVSWIVMMFLFILIIKLLVFILQQYQKKTLKMLIPYPVNLVPCACLKPIFAVEET